jgi:tetratricopeptide (TPR) repeat protein
VTLLNKLRGAVARQRIAGTLHEFGATVSLDTRFRLARAIGEVKVRRRLDSDDEFFDAVDDLSFELAKRRIAVTASIEDFGTEANTWKGYRSFLAAHGSHLTFIRTGRAMEREDAIRCYEAAIEAEPGYALAHYNLATLLYNRYTSADNSNAIDHFRRAAEAPSDRIRALALAGLAMAYSQNVHRFGQPTEPWAFWAHVASERAIELEPDLEETRLARAWANQVLGDMEEAVSWYERAADAPNHTAKARQLQSFALCNAGWICLNHLDQEPRAEELLQKSLRLYDNKVTHANLGEIYKRRQEFESAKREFEAAISIDPRYVNALNEFGMLYIRWASEGSEETRAVEGGASANGASTTDELLAEARTWHERAIAVLNDNEGQSRLHELFGEECERCGFREEAQREMNEAAVARKAAMRGDSQ